MLPPIPNEEEAASLVPLRRFGALHEAELAASALDAAGIDAVVQNRFVAGAYHELTNAVGGVTLLVAAEDVDAANEVLSGAGLEPAASPDRAPRIAADCAGCGRRLERAMADCPDCNALPERDVATPRGRYWTILRLKFAIAAFVLLAGVGLPAAWDRLTQLPENVVAGAAYALVALIIGLALRRTLRRWDERA